MQPSCSNSLLLVSDHTSLTTCRDLLDNGHKGTSLQQWNAFWALLMSTAFIRFQDKRTMAIERRRTSGKQACMRVALMLVSIHYVKGFSSSSFTVRIPDGTKNIPMPTERRSSGRRGDISMYLPPSTPVSQTAPMVAKSILAAPAPFNSGKKRPHSSSVLASTDTLPSFQTAHGLLSPETVMRMDETMCRKHQVRDKAVTMFLDTYRSQGPMACLPMLSDPAILPRLTEAMRDIC